MTPASENKCPFAEFLACSGTKPRGRLYGLLFESIQFYMCQDYGEMTWNTILEGSGVGEAYFCSKKTYPDEWMVNLARSTQNVLQSSSINDAMFYFGTCFVNYCRRMSYDKILRNAGRTFRDFLHEIDNIHETIRFSYPKMQSPLFIVQSEDRDGCVLLYCSMRIGFTYYVMGQLQECAKQFYQVKVNFNVVKEITSEKGCHVTLRLNFDNYAFSPPQLRVTTPSHRDHYACVRSQTFFKLFPFCLVFNSKLKIIGCGARLAGFLQTNGGQSILGTTMTDIFNLRRPLVDFTWNHVKSLQMVIFEMSLKRDKRRIEAADKRDGTVNGERTIHETMGGVSSKKPLLRGQMKYIAGWDAMAFLCTPVISCLDDLLKNEMYLGDLNLFDNSRDLVLAGQRNASDIEYQMEWQKSWSQQIEDTLVKLDKARWKSDQLINSMLTMSIADRLKSGSDPIDTCESFSQVTVLFTNLVNFSDVCTLGTPFQVVECVQNYTKIFDDIVEKHQLFKVETLGDGVYMVAGGVPDRCEDHAQRVAGLALDLVDNARHVKNPVTNESMQVLVGMHSGGVVAGIVGHRSLQYCLFGDTVNTAARMQTNSLPDRILLTKPCHDCLHGSGFTTVFRGCLCIKGKGVMKTFWLLGKEDQNTVLKDGGKSQGVIPLSSR